MHITSNKTSLCMQYAILHIFVEYEALYTDW